MSREKLSDADWARDRIESDPAALRRLRRARRLHDTAECLRQAGEAVMTAGEALNLNREWPEPEVLPLGEPDPERQREDAILWAYRVGMHFIDYSGKVARKWRDHD